MTTSSLTKISKFLSYILRHHPESIGVEIDSHGWVHVPTLIRRACDNGRHIDQPLILDIIEKSDKQRFKLSDDGNYIRAGYGHSFDVDLGLDPLSPPAKLYHGTARRNLDSIRKEGLHSGSRNLVHLSAEKKEATAVGDRHGKPHVLTVKAQKMYRAGRPFYQSDSEPNIWLTEEVPPEFMEGFTF